jgi:predicted nuclease of predicted toxin-antitoxin system
MVNGILADVNIVGQVAYLVQIMQSPAWAGFWQALGLVLLQFDDVGLTDQATDLEIWQRCQQRQLILVTNNRNDDGPDSLEAAIRHHNTANALPIFTIGNVSRLETSRTYAEEVVESLYEYLLRIDDVRGAGRLFLP